MSGSEIYDKKRTFYVDLNDINYTTIYIYIYSTILYSPLIIYCDHLNMIVLLIKTAFDVYI